MGEKRSTRRHAGLVNLAHLGCVVAREDLADIWARPRVETTDRHLFSVNGAFLQIFLTC